MAKAWFDERPGLLQEELEALANAGIACAVNESLQRQGILELEIQMKTDDEELHLVARYPDSFPYVRPVVIAPELDLGRHQHPFDRNLCLLGRSTANWTSDQSLAWLLTEQLPRVLAAARDPMGPAAEEEERQGEPYSDYYVCLPGASVALDSRWLIGTADRGNLRIRLNKRVPEHAPNIPIVRGIISEIRAVGGGALYRADAELLRLIPDGTDLAGRWFRVDHMPRQALEKPQVWAPMFVEELRAIDPRMAVAQHEQFGRNLWIDVLGLVFEEEQEWRQTGEGWIFFVRVGRRQSARQRQRHGEEWAGYLAKAVRLGRDDLAARVPELADLAGKRAALIGVGGIGGPIALELARAGIGELRILDGDIADPATLVRWPFGYPASLRPKVHVLKEWIEANIPYVRVTAEEHRLGRVRADPDEASDLEVLARLLDGADVVVDATAEAGLHPLIADLARHRRIPYVEGLTRNGAWGGVIARVANQPGDPCQNCLAFRLRDLDAQEQPARSPEGLRQPLGCADPTFTGAGFDVASISVATARLAVATLLRGVPDGYPDPAWDIGIMNLRAHDGSAGVPEWLTFPLERHPECMRRTH
jgi:molybdopterin/thiamine biosynthesis adenylyltransferase